MTHLGPPQSRTPGAVTQSFLHALLAAACLILQTSSATAGQDPAALQKQGIQLIDNYRNYVRRTGDMTSQLPQLQQAQIALTYSAKGFLAQQNLTAAALCLIKLGDIERLQNHWDAARPLYARARDFAKQANHPAYQAQALLQMTRTELLGRGDLGAAADYVTQAMPLATASRDQDILFDAFDMAAEVEVKRGNLNAAADDLDHAFAIKDQLHDKTLAMYAYMDQADLFYARASKCDYDTNFAVCDSAFQTTQDDYSQAFQLAQSFGFEFLARQMRTLLDGTTQQRKLTQARGRYSQNLIQTTSGMFHPRKPSDVLVTQHYTPGPDPAMQAQIEAIIRAQLPKLDDSDLTGNYIQGLSAEMKGDNEAALDHFRKSIALLERDRRNLRDEQSRGSFLQDKVDVYYKPALLLLDLRRTAEAFDLIERSRSRAMADLLANRSLSLRTPLERDLFSQWMKLKADIALQQKKLAELLADKDAREHAAAITDAKTKIAALQEQYEKLQADISARAPKLGQLTSPSNSVSLADAQAAANRDGYDILYYLIGESSVVVWDINGQGASAFNVFLPHTQLNAKLNALRSSLLAHENDPNAKFDDQTSRELFLFLVQPVLPSVKTNHVVIVPHEELNNLNFQVLQNPADGAFLGEKFQISYAPSATVLASLKKKANLASGKLLAAADPNITDSVDEVHAIGQLYPTHSKIVENVLLNKEEVRNLVSGYDIVHLSMHGSFQPNDPVLSYLSLAPTDQDNGHLTAAEMFALPLAQESIIVLSACQTGQVEATHSNEVLGMVRALLYAGANDLVLSSWQVQSKATSIWMENFYRAAQTHPPSEAARLALLAVKARPEYRDPYFWGPFLLTGK